jgi:hypothetical protein
MHHIAGHFENRRLLDDCRPDFQVWKDMWNEGCLSNVPASTFEEYMKNNTERPYVEGLQPHDWVPPEVKQKAKVERRIANRVVVDTRLEERERRRARQAS